MRNILVIVALAIGVSVGAQQIPTLTREQLLEVQLIAARQQLALAQAELQICTGKLAPTTYKESMSAIDTELQAFADAFAAQHPGWMFDPATGIKKVD